MKTRTHPIARVLWIHPQLSHRHDQHLRAIQHILVAEGREPNPWDRETYIVVRYVNSSSLEYPF